MEGAKFPETKDRGRRLERVGPTSLEIFPVHDWLMVKVTLRAKTGQPSSIKIVLDYSTRKT